MFRENGIDYDKVDYFNEPLSEEKLRGLLKKTGLTPFAVLRKGESIARELGLNAETPPDELIRLIVENPRLMQRPIVEVGDKAVLARPIEKVFQILAKT